MRGSHQKLFAAASSINNSKAALETKRESTQSLSRANTSRQTHRSNIDSSIEPIATLPGGSFQLFQVDRFNSEVSPILGRGANVDPFEPLWGIVEKVQHSLHHHTFSALTGGSRDSSAPLGHLTATEILAWTGFLIPLNFDQGRCKVSQHPLDFVFGPDTIQ